MGTPRSTTLPHLTFRFQPTPTIPQQPETEETEDEDNMIPDDIMTVIDNDLPNTINLHNNKSDIDSNSENEDEAEAAPQWEFDPNEEFSKDETYLFCLLPHCQQLLCLFTCHFCCHPFFPTCSGIHQTSSEVQNQSVAEMYYFCKQRGLSEVWPYMWSSWYSPPMWKLWARSSDGCILSRLQTTMMSENHWKQLKHHYLGFMHCP